jgi:hypothetical protein
MGKICWQSTIRNLHAAATVRFDSQLRKTITHQAATARNLAPTIHCDLHRLNCKTQTHSTNKEEKSPGTQLHLRTQIEPTSTAKHRRQSPSRTRANFSLQHNVHFPKKTQCVLQFLTFISHPSCSSSSAICQG